MFITTSMVDHDEEMRTEQDLIVMYAAVNLKQNLRLKLLTDTKHRAASLR